MTSLAYEIENILLEKSSKTSLYEDSDLIKGYQKLLDEGVITRRGFTLQTIEDKIRDIPDVKITYTASGRR